MMKQVNFCQLKITGAIATLLLNTGLFGLSLSTQAQNQTDQEQNTALQAFAKITEGKRT